MTTYDPEHPELYVPEAEQRFTVQVYADVIVPPEGPVRVEIPTVLDTDFRIDDPEEDLDDEDRESAWERVRHSSRLNGEMTWAIVGDEDDQRGPVEDGLTGLDRHRLNSQLDGWIRGTLKGYIPSGFSGPSAAAVIARALGREDELPY